MGACCSKRQKLDKDDPALWKGDKEQALLTGRRRQYSTICEAEDLTPKRYPKPQLKPYHHPNLTRDQAADRLQALRTLINFSDKEIRENLRLIESDAKVEGKLLSLQRETYKTLAWVKRKKISKSHLERITEEISLIEQACWAAQSLLLSLSRIRDPNIHTCDTLDGPATLKARANGLVARISSRETALRQLRIDVQSASAARCKALKAQGQGFVMTAMWGLMCES